MALKRPKKAACHRSSHWLPKFVNRPTKFPFVPAQQNSHLSPTLVPESPKQAALAPKFSLQPPNFPSGEICRQMVNKVVYQLDCCGTVGMCPWPQISLFRSWINPSYNGPKKATLTSKFSFLPPNFAGDEICRRMVNKAVYQWDCCGIVEMCLSPKICLFRSWIGKAKKAAAAKW